MTDASGIKAVDSLSAYEFTVEINGETISGIFSVSGLTSYREDEIYPPLIIAKMVQQNPNSIFNKWARETVAGKMSVRDVAIVAVDEGVETRRWVYKNSYITAIDFSTFDTASSELVEERVTIKAERVEEHWPNEGK
ncbi:MAG: hypothetical protein JW910_11465 [Anaerolineae bacterium]|nr:hypothetical protein [Anaerolineae bacterium]